MKVDVRYRGGDPKRITTAGHGMDSEFVFTIEGDTARLVDVRANTLVDKGTSALSVSELSHAHDAVLTLPFVDRVTVWMKGRTDTTFEDTADE